jgi:hypothetical protein
MARMTGIPNLGRRPAGLLRMLLVLALLAGVLAMHALSPVSPVGLPAMGEHAAVTDVPAAAAAPASRTAHAAAHAHTAGDTCTHLDGPGSLAMDHSGGTCAAGGTSTAYAPPPPVPTAVGSRAPADMGAGRPPAGTVDGRAPPDLAQLQLLRI